ncbi:hypothetical protein, partial [Variovorax boronicumulans]
ALEKVMEPSGISCIGIVDILCWKAPGILTCQNLIHMLRCTWKGPQIQSKIVPAANVCDNCGFP